MGKNQKIAFLAYLNRSGSTYLSKILNRYKEIGVTIEGGSLPDGIVSKEIVINNEKEIKKRIEVLFKNKKFRYWKVNEKEILEIINKINKFPISFHELFPFIVELYFKKIGRFPSVMIYKSTWRYLKHFDLIKKRYKDSKLIFIIRDGRAIYNSQAKSLSSISKKKMSDSPIRTAKLYNEVVKYIKVYEGFKDFLLVRYEDLILKQDKVISEIFKFLDVADKSFINYDYEKDIPKEQKHLHNNLKKPPLVKRVNAWENELSKEEIFIFQLIAKRSLVYMRYKLKEIKFSRIKSLYLLVKYYVDYYLKRLKDKINAFKNFDYLINRIWYKLFFKVKK